MAAPTIVSPVPATGTTITAATPLQFDVDASATLAGVVVEVAFAGSGQPELAYVNGAFTSAYAGTSTFTNIGGFNNRFVLNRSSGWPAAPTVNTFAFDTTGLTNAATPLSWLLTTGLNLTTGVNTAIGPRYPFYLADAFRDSLRRRALQGNNPASFTDTQLLNLLNEELNAWLVPTYIGCSEGQYIHYVSVPVTANVSPLLLGSGTVDLPSAAWGSQIRSMAAVDGGGNPIAQISVELDPGWGPNAWGGVGGSPRAYYITNSQIQLLGDPGSNTVGIWFFKRPSRLCFTQSLGATPGQFQPLSGPSACLEVTSVATFNGTSYQINVNGYALPMFQNGQFNTINSSQVLLEVNQGRPPFQNRVGAFTPTVTPGASDSFVQVPSVGGALPVDGGGNVLIQPGDWLTVAGYSPVLVDTPVEVVPFFVEWCNAKMMASRGDADSMKNSLGLQKAAEQGLKELLEPRNQAAERYVDSGLKRTGGGYWWGWRRG